MVMREYDKPMVIWVMDDAIVNPRHRLKGTAIAISNRHHKSIFFIYMQGTSMIKICMSTLAQSRLLPPMACTAAVLVLLTGCQTVTPNNSDISRSDSATNTASVLPTQTALTPAVQAVVGDYASKDYDKRQQGYDWVGVMVQPDGEADIDIKVRARSDIKKPSCHYEGKATLMGQDTAHGVIFQTIANDSVTFLQFKEGKLTIDSQDKQALNYFCSGGATLAGDYQKLTGHLKLS